MHLHHSIPLGAGLLAVLLALPGWSKTGSEPLSVQFEQGDEALTVRLGDELFARYVFRGAPKPYLWPIIGPTGDEMTRAYPMEQRAGEASDHPHQRSLWFTHGDVNGVDFWSEGPKAGRQVHREFVTVQAKDDHGLVHAVTDWVGPDGKKMAEDTRELRFRGTANRRILDFDVTVRAIEGPLVFGDTKEGSFGIRVASSMDVDRKKGGRIVNSRGETDAAAWGRPAEWVDYSGPVGGRTVGITVLNHPSSFRHPTHWHVRTYGLFAANPFGLRDFSGEQSKGGSYTVPAGQSITLRYRVVFHEGEAASAPPEAAYREYAATEF